MKEAIRLLRRQIRQIRRRKGPLKINPIKDGLEFLTEIFTPEGPIEQPSPRVEAYDEVEYSELPFDNTRDLQTKAPIEADPSPVVGEGEEKPLARQPQSKMDLITDERVKWDRVGTVWFGPSGRNKGGLVD